MSEIEKLLYECGDVEKMLDEPDELTKIIKDNSLVGSDDELQDDELNQVTGGCLLAKFHIKEKILKQIDLLVE